MEDNLEACGMHVPCMHVVHTACACWHVIILDGDFWTVCAHVGELCFLQGDVILHVGMVHVC